MTTSVPPPKSGARAEPLGDHARGGARLARLPQASRSRPRRRPARSRADRRRSAPDATAPVARPGARRPCVARRARCRRRPRPRSRPGWSVGALIPGGGRGGHAATAVATASGAMPASRRVAGPCGAAGRAGARHRSARFAGGGEVGPRANSRRRAAVAGGRVRTAPRRPSRVGPRARREPGFAPAVVRPPVAWTRRSSTVGLDGHAAVGSVRKTRAPTAASRSSACRVGCPYGLPVPALTTATRGRRAARKASVEAVRLP